MKKHKVTYYISTLPRRAALAHLMAGDGEAAPAVVALALVTTSYWSRQKLTGDVP